MKHLNHLQTFESFDNDMMINESVQLSDNLKQKIKEFVAKYRNILVKILAPFKGKSEQEIIQAIQTKTRANEGWSDIKNIISKFFNIASMGTSGVGLLSALYGLFQLAQTDMAGKPLIGGAIAILAAIVMYAVSQIFSTTD